MFIKTSDSKIETVISFDELTEEQKKKLKKEKKEEKEKQN